MGRNLRNIAIEETSVITTSLFGKNIDVSTRGKGSAGLIEADVSVCADSKNLEVNATGIANCLVVVSRGLLIVAGPDVGAVRGSLGEIYAVRPTYSSRLKD